MKLNTYNSFVFILISYAGDTNIISPLHPFNSSLQINKESIEQV